MSVRIFADGAFVSTAAWDDVPTIKEELKRFG
jgi:hypothetical protein